MNCVLGEIALGDVDLTAAADAPPAADRIEIDAERARGREQARAFGELAALAGGREDDAIWVKGGPWLEPPLPPRCRAVPLPAARGGSLATSLGG